MAFRYLKGNHTFFSATILHRCNKGGQGRAAGWEEEVMEKKMGAEQIGRNMWSEEGKQAAGFDFQKMGQQLPACI